MYIIFIMIFWIQPAYHDHSKTSQHMGSSLAHLDSRARRVLVMTSVTPATTVTLDETRRCPRSGGYRLPINLALSRG